MCATNNNNNNNNNSNVPLQQQQKRRRLILADFPLNVDRARLTQYISSWMLEPQVDADSVAHFNDVVRAETRADV